MTALHRGRVSVTLTTLTKALHLPPGHEIAAVHSSDPFNDTFDIMITGPDLPLVPEGEVTPRVTVLFTETLGEPKPERIITAAFKW